MAQWLEHRGAKSEGLRSLSHARDRTKKASFSNFLPSSKLTIALISINKHSEFSLSHARDKTK